MIKRPAPNSGYKLLRETETSIIFYKETDNDQSLCLKGRILSNYFDKKSKKYVDVTKRGYEYIVLDKEYEKETHELIRLKNVGAF